MKTAIGGMMSQNGGGPAEAPPATLGHVSLAVAGLHLEADEADAGVVYTTDAAVATKDVTQVTIPAQYNVIAQYPIAVVKDSKNAAVAQAWVDFILSEAGQAILQKDGFDKP